MNNARTDFFYPSAALVAEALEERRRLIKPLLDTTAGDERLVVKQALCWLSMLRNDVQEVMNDTPSEHPSYRVYTLTVAILLSRLTMLFVDGHDVDEEIRNEALCCVNRVWREIHVLRARGEDASCYEALCTTPCQPAPAGSSVFDYALRLLIDGRLPEVVLDSSPCCCEA